MQGGPKLSYTGKVLTEHRQGLVVQAQFGLTTGTIERNAAQMMIVRHSRVHDITQCSAFREQVDKEAARLCEGAKYDGRASCVFDRQRVRRLVQKCVVQPRH